MDPESPLFVEVVLARVASCDACLARMARGARAHLVSQPHGKPRVRCAACVDSGAAPAPSDAAPAPSYAAPAPDAAPIRAPSRDMRARTAEIAPIAASFAPLSLRASGLTARSLVETLALAGAASLVSLLRS